MRFDRFGAECELDKGFMPRSQRKTSTARQPSAASAGSKGAAERIHGRAGECGLSKSGGKKRWRNERCEVESAEVRERVMRLGCVYMCVFRAEGRRGGCGRVGRAGWKKLKMRRARAVRLC